MEKYIYVPFAGEYEEAIKQRTRKGRLKDEYLDM